MAKRARRSFGLCAHEAGIVGHSIEYGRHSLSCYSDGAARISVALGLKDASATGLIDAVRRLEGQDESERTLCNCGVPLSTKTYWCGQLTCHTELYLGFVGVVTFVSDTVPITCYINMPGLPLHPSIPPSSFFIIYMGARECGRYQHRVQCDIT